MHLPAALIESGIRGTDPLSAVRELLDRLVAAGEISSGELSAMLASWSDPEQINLGAYWRWAYPTLASESISESVAAFGRSHAGINFGTVDELPIEFIFLSVIPALKFDDPVESTDPMVRRVPTRAWRKQWIRYDRWRQEMEPELQRDNALRACADAEQIAIVLARRQPVTARKQPTTLPRVHAGIASLFPVSPADFIIENS